MPPPATGPHKTRSKRFVRWSQAGLFNRVFAALARDGGAPATVMIDAPHVKAPRPAASLLKKGRLRAALGAPGGGLNSQLPAVGTRAGNPLILLLTAGQVSEYRGAATVLPRPAGRGGPARR